MTKHDQMRKLVPSPHRKYVPFTQLMYYIWCPKKDQFTQMSVIAIRGSFDLTCSLCGDTFNFFKMPKFSPAEFKNLTRSNFFND